MFVLKTLCSIFILLRRNGVLCIDVEIDESLNDLPQDDPDLIEIISDYYLHQPSFLGYSLKNGFPTDIRGQFHQAYEVARLYDFRKTNGFFVEAGAYDGLKLSNTILMETQYNWTGLLVEPNPFIFESLLEKNRRVWSINHCLSRETTPEVVEFDACSLYGGIIQEGKPKPGDNIPDHAAYLKTHRPYPRDSLYVQCFPLYSILTAINQTVIDYFSLDIEGAELEVLRTIPWSKLDIRVLTIEVVREKWNDLSYDFEDPFPEILKLMEENGYIHYKTMVYDEIFIKNDFELPSHIDLEKERASGVRGVSQNGKFTLSPAINQ